MTATTQLVTLAASAVALPAPPATGALICRLFVEQLRTNTHAAFFGTSAVTNDGSGTGVIRELAVPSATLLESFNIENPGWCDTIDPTKFSVHGTTGEKLKVTYFQN